MRQNRLISNLIAIVLLLAISQKIGFEIFYHNWQHSKNCSSTLPRSAPAIFGANCNCIDDFSMPFTETDEQILCSAPAFLQQFGSSPIVSILNSLHFFNSLRAPPALFC